MKKIPIKHKELIQNSAQQLLRIKVRQEKEDTHNQYYWWAIAISGLIVAWTVLTCLSDTDIIESGLYQSFGSLGISLGWLVFFASGGFLYQSKKASNLLDAEERSCLSFLKEEGYYMRYNPSGYVALYLYINGELSDHAFDPFSDDAYGL